MFTLTGFKKTDKLFITTDRNVYTPFVSSVRGIKMSPEFKPVKKYGELQYHWTADQGSFIGDASSFFGNEVKNEGESVLWSAASNDKVVDIKDPFYIKLEIINTEDKKVVASSKLLIKPDKGLYKVQKQKHRRRL